MRNLIQVFEKEFNTAVENSDPNLYSVTTVDNVLQKAELQNRKYFESMLLTLMQDGSKIKNLENLEKLHRLAKEGNSALVLGAHFTNFDVPALYTLLKAEGPKYEQIFDDIIDKNTTKEDYESCIDCNFLISGHLLYRPNLEGFKALKSHFKNVSASDSEIEFFVNEFSSYLEELELLKTLLITTVNDNLKLWKQTYDWFPDFYRGKPNEDFMTYKLGSEYRNLVTYHSAIIYDN